MAAAPFSCECGKIKGEVAAMTKGGIHLVCYCEYCRAGALHSGDSLEEGAPLDLYLTPPHNITISAGRENLEPFAFSPKGIVRWKASCCKGQMFSTQSNPKTAFMSICTERLETPTAAGPIVTKSFVPKPNGKTGQQGVGGLIRLIFMAIGARISGKWKKTALYDTSTLKPIIPVTVLPKGEKAKILGNRSKKA